MLEDPRALSCRARVAIARDDRMRRRGLFPDLQRRAEGRSRDDVPRHEQPARRDALHLTVRVPPGAGSGINAVRTKRSRNFTGRVSLGAGSGC